VALLYKVQVYINGNARRGAIQKPGPPGVLNKRCLASQHEGWKYYSKRFKENKRKCQWCNKKTVNVYCHHVGCVQYNPDHLFDPRIILIVCRNCHKLLEPWSKINLIQYLPQLYKRVI